MDKLLYALILATVWMSGYAFGYAKYHLWFMKNVIEKGHRNGGACEHTDDN